MITLTKYYEQKDVKILSEKSNLFIPCALCGEKLNFYLTYVVEEEVEEEQEIYLVCEKCRKEEFGNLSCE